MEALLLRFDAPLVSFGGPVVDQINPTRDFPGRAMLAGLFGNALGYRHGDAALLDALQRRLRYAAREDRPGRPFMDYQTVSFLTPHMREPGWTSYGHAEKRQSGVKVETSIRYRHYIADAVYLVVIGLAAGDGVDLDALDRAVQRPARPLFLGRKCCLPSTPLRYGRANVARLRDALTLTPRIERKDQRPRAGGETARLRAWWPVDEGAEVGRTIAVTDDMDWSNQIHVGRRYMQEAFVELTTATTGERAS